MTDLSSWLIVIPARLDSSRLPRKILCDLGGKPLIVRVYENLASLLNKGLKIVVAIDHEDTACVCKAHRIPYRTTSKNHTSGSDRVWEVSQMEKSYPFILNVQGDEPFVQVSDLLQLMAYFEKNPHLDTATMIVSITSREANDPNKVKVVVNKRREAIYFSRTKIPFYRKTQIKEQYWQHIGVYAYRQSSLDTFTHLPPSQLEQCEQLEQLRFYDHGMNIGTIKIARPSLGIDVEQDLQQAKKIFKKIKILPIEQK